MVLSHEWDVSRRLARSPRNRRPWWVSHPVPETPPITLEAESAAARVIVLVSGEIDALTAPHLEAFVAGRSLAGCAVLELDLAGVPSIASAGLSALLGLRAWGPQRGGGPPGPRGARSTGAAAAPSRRCGGSSRPPSCTGSSRTARVRPAPDRHRS